MCLLAVFWVRYQMKYIHKSNTEYPDSTTYFRAKTLSTIRSWIWRLAMSSLLYPAPLHSWSCPPSTSRNLRYHLHSTIHMSKTFLLFNSTWFFVLFFIVIMCRFAKNGIVPINLYTLVNVLRSLKIVGNHWKPAGIGQWSRHRHRDRCDGHCYDIVCFNL